MAWNWRHLRCHYVAGAIGRIGHHHCAIGRKWICQYVCYQYLAFSHFGAEGVIIPAYLRWRRKTKKTQSTARRISHTLFSTQKLKNLIVLKASYFERLQRRITNLGSGTMLGKVTVGMTLPGLANKRLEKETLPMLRRPSAPPMESWPCTHHYLPAAAPF